MAEKDSLQGSKFIKVRWTKLTVSGPSATGKSSALRLLLNEDPVDEHDSTPVVETFVAKDRKGRPWQKLKTIDEMNSIDDDHHFIYGVDTGGQAAFLDIAPALLRFNSVNIVTHRLDEKLDDKTSFYYSVQGKRIGEPIKRQLTNQQVLEMSMRSLASVKPPNLEGIEFRVVTSNEPDDRTSGTVSKTSNAGKPSFIVLGTFRDLLNKEESIEEKNRKLKAMLEWFNNDTAVESHEGSIIFPVNTLGRDVNEMEIADAVRRVVRQSYIEAEIPEKWFKFQLKINELQRSETTTAGQPANDKSMVVMSTSQCEDIGSSLGLSCEEVKSALMYLHNLTVILYFPDILPKIVFLQPQPLFDKLSELISVSFADGVNKFEGKAIDLDPTAHEDMKNKGLFKQNLLKTEGFMGNDYKAEDFLSLLEGLQIVIKLPNEANGIPKYFIPCVLPSINSEKLKELCSKHTKSVDPLVLKWEGRVIPQGLFCALVLSLLQEKVAESKGFLEKKTQYRNAIEMPCCSLGGDIMLVESAANLEVYYSGLSSNCHELRKLVYEHIGKAVERFRYNRHLSTPTLCFYSDSTKESEIPIFVDGENTSKFSSRQEPWLRDLNVPVHSRNQFHEKIASVREAQMFLEKYNFKTSRDWFELGGKLELSETVMDEIGANFASSTTECLRQCLSLWLEKDQGKEDKTWNTLVTAMKSVYDVKMEPN